MLLYLDLNCFNRPFDDQSQERIARETRAVFRVLQRILDGKDRLAWSDILELENSQHPLADRRAEIGSWAERAAIWVPADRLVATRAAELAKWGLSPLDAAHLACAEVGGCEALLTCDDRLIRRAGRSGPRLQVVTPVGYLDHHEQG